MSPKERALPDRPSCTVLSSYKVKTRACELAPGPEDRGSQDMRSGNLVFTIKLNNVRVTLVYRDQLRVFNEPTFLSSTAVGGGCASCSLPSWCRCSTRSPSSWSTCTCTRTTGCRGSGTSASGPSAASSTTSSPPDSSLGSLRGEGGESNSKLIYSSRVGLLYCNLTSNMFYNPQLNGEYLVVLCTGSL